ncbi:MAG: hypothetical protein KGI51_06440 [Rhodospirillales bacterium]|nr:hypothetical protein [Rhodospirillales bacterium]
MSQTTLSASAFRSLVQAFAELRVPLSGAPSGPSHAAQELRRQLRDEIGKVSDARWRHLLQHMREAAEDGQKDYRLLRFPCDEARDGGRAIREQEPQWPATLTGEAADIYQHWEAELKSRGFQISARELEYPGGLPGDVGLFIGWA